MIGARVLRLRACILHVRWPHAELVRNFVQIFAVKSLVHFRIFDNFVSVASEIAADYGGRILLRAASRTPQFRIAPLKST